MSSESEGKSAAATASPNPTFKLENITKRFGGTVAVNNVDFDLCPGEVHALIGENGAGKSTLMKIVAGIHAPDEGSFEVDGQKSQFASPREAEEAGIAMIPQELNLFTELSIAENLFVGRDRPRSSWGGLGWGAMQAEARRQFESFNVDFDVTVPVKRLSMANRQLVAIVRALMGDAKAIIMDEPTASLAGEEVRRLFGIVSDLTSNGVGIVYVSHRLEEIFEISDRVTVLRDGEHVETAPTSEMDSEKLVRLMVGRSLEELFSRHPHEPGEVALEVRDLTREGEFENVNLNVRRGEVVGLAGLVGAGRTELAQAIFGINPAEAGEILVNGEAVKMNSPTAAMQHGVFYVPEERQSQGLILPFPINANITLSILDRISRLGFVRRDSEKKSADKFAESLSIKGAAMTAPVSQLSGGNQQKVVLAKSLACEPSILLLDEPTRGIDVGAKSEIYRLIDELAGEDKAVLLISSELEEVLSMSDRIVVMREGLITGELTREEATQEKVMAAATGTGDSSGVDKADEEGENNE
jgi:ABC-type sugar transport system ATPase subunit